MAFSYIKGVPDGFTGTKEHRDVARQKAESQVPRSERRREGLGLPAPLSVQTVDGLCTLERKCIFKDGHAQPCWPGD